jgi:DNA-binding transcriptional regulator PaaX
VKVNNIELRILRFLKVADFKLKYATFIAAKFDMSYDHIRKALTRMTLKGWLEPHTHNRRVYYRTTEKCPRVWRADFKSKVTKNDRF